VNGDKVGLREKYRHRLDLASGTEGHEVDDVVEEDAHPERFGEYRELRADVTIADDPKGLSTDLPAVLGLLVPGALTQLEGALKVLPREGDDLGYDELGHGTRVGEGRVEDRDASFCSGDQIDLVYADTEAPDNEELGNASDMSTGDPASIWASLRYLGGSLYDSFGDLGLAANADGVVLADPLNEVVLIQRLCMVIDSPAIGFKCFDSVLADVF
jgi:hypothetical protein